MGCQVDELDEDCNVVHGMDGNVLNTQVNMINMKFADGHPQSLYWPKGYERMGIFKAMAAILQEHRFANILKLQAQCPIEIGENVQASWISSFIPP